MLILHQLNAIKLLPCTVVLYALLTDLIFLSVIIIIFDQMLMNPMGGIVMTNDGNAILREIQVQHPAAKTMIEISRTQDEEVGDGTTSVIVLGKCI